MFLPYRTDLEFNRVPVITLLVCSLCIIIFIRQLQSDSSVVSSAQRYCEQDHPRQFWLTLKKLTGNDAADACPAIFAGIYSTANPNKVILNLAERAAPWDLMTPTESRDYTAEQLRNAFDEFKQDVRPSLTSKLEYNPATFNLWHMITAAFAHGSWSHLIGNLIFFYAFATAVEIILGSTQFALIILLLAVGTHSVYAVSQHMAHSATPTLGLSGVVMGIIGLFVYLIPNANIRSLLWILVFWRVLRVPAWLLAVWYVGWDVYDLMHSDGSSNVNFVAHISGAALVYLTGMLFFKERKEWAQAQLNN